MCKVRLTKPVPNRLALLGLMPGDEIKVKPEPGSKNGAVVYEYQLITEAPAKRIREGKETAGKKIREARTVVLFPGDYEEILEL